MHRFLSICVTLVLFVSSLAGCRLISTVREGGEKELDSSKIRYVETHMHFDARAASRGQLEGLPEVVLDSMDEAGIAKVFIMPQPQPYAPGHRGLYEYPVMVEALKNYPDEFEFLAGGGTLNPLIQKAVKEGEVTSETRKEFEAKAKEIVDAGAVGFGEMTALHLSLREGHPYEAAPPDHELFLLLADLSAGYGVPIDLHMEAVVEDIPTPEDLRGYHNPTMLDENVSAFERLLAHNRKAKIVWQHTGWDNTGHMTVDLLRRLLKAHPNLYLSFKNRGQNPRERTGLNGLFEDDEIKDEWLKLIGDFPSRFVLGADNHYSSARRGPDSASASRFVLNELPLSLARKVAYENVEHVYGVKVADKEMESEKSYEPSELKPLRDGDTEKGRRNGKP